MGKQNKKPSAMDQLHKSFKDLSKVTEDEFIGRSAINTARIKLIVELQEQNSKIIKLNEELTAENARLLTELEGITSDKNAAEYNYDICHNKLEGYMEVNRIYTEWIADVKSKWWYKLMTWGW